MFAVSSLVRSRLFQSTALLACLLLPLQLHASPDGASIRFHAVSLPLSESAELAPTTGSEEQITFAAFVPMAEPDAIRTLIDELETAGDYFSPRIAEHSAELGKALQAMGQHTAALQEFERSQQIWRRQDGLYSAAQASLLQARIDSHLALGNMEVSHDLQQALFVMQQQIAQTDPVALAESHEAWADWNVRVYLHAQQNPLPGGRSSAQDEALALQLAEAFMQYHKALWQLSRIAQKDQYQDKVELERKIAALMLMVNREHRVNAPALIVKQQLHSFNQDKRSNNPVLVGHGSSALQRAIEYSVASAEPELIAGRMMELGDWYLLLDQRDEASSTYAQAGALLRDAGFDEARIARVLESGLPVHNPESSLEALTGDEVMDEFDGYIDVAFDVDGHGKASNARILAATGQDESVERNLVEQIRSGRFRPGFDQDLPVGRKDVTLRYYFSR